MKNAVTIKISCALYIRYVLAPLATLGSIATASAAREAPPAASGQQPELRSVSPGPHWRPAFTQADTEVFRCAGATTVEVASTYRLHPGGRQERQVRSVAINGRPIGDAAIARVNGVLRPETFDLQLRPQCFGERVRLHVYRLTERVVTIAYVDLE